MLTIIDNITIVLCVVGIFAISIFMSKRNTDMEAYYHANKALPWSLAVGTIAASWYGGNGTIGTVGYVTTMGLSAFFIWSIGAHLVRFPLALWVAPRISVKVNSTMTELLDRFYGRIASFVGALILIVTSLSLSEISACGYVGVAAWDANKFVAAAVVIAISIGLTCVGGLLGVAITDMIFFFLMIVSVAVVFPSAFYGIGGFAALDEILGAVDTTMMMPFGGIPMGRAIVLILVCINVYKDPAFYQRFTASNGPKVGKRAMLTCFSIWLSMDVCLMFTAIVLRAMDPALTIQPEVAYIQLVLSGLPPIGRGLFIFAMMGAIISTVDTYYLVGGEIVSNDIVGVLRKNPLSDKESIWISRIACVIFGIIGLSVAFRFPLVYDAMIFVTSLSMSALFVPVIVAIMYDGKKTNMSGILSMFAGIISWVWFTYNPLSIEWLGGDIDAMLVSLPISFVAFLIGNQFGRVLNTGFVTPEAGAALEGTVMTSSGPVSQEEYKREIRVEWFGIDGALCLVYAVLACFYSFGIINRIDWIVGWAAPVVAGGTTTVIFLRYLYEVFTFGKTPASK
ncbi:MAG: sodium:solute symporter family protein [Lawsonibacter sp.]|nr:sodium:solute symporter family protein [Lawsonibacter sp.]